MDAHRSRNHVGTEGVLNEQDNEAEAEVSGLKVSSVSRTAGVNIVIKWDESNLKVAYKDEYT